MYLIDTNVFLEVLLAQERQAVCKDFLAANVGKLHVSDFSLHSIGVILFRNDRVDIFHKFVSDVLPNIEITSLAKKRYEDLAGLKAELGLDFDDAYQYKVAEEHRLGLVTMDRHFEKVRDRLKVRFLQDTA